MTDREITHTLHGPVPFKKIVNRLSEKQCLEILDAIKIDEAAVRKPTPVTRMWWASIAPSHTSEEIQKTKIAELDQASALLFDRLAQLEVKRGIA